MFLANSSRSGFTLVELILFLAVTAFIGSIIIGLLLSTQDSRVRQRRIAEMESGATQALLTMTRTVRRAEQVLDPPSGSTGSVLTVQMGATGEHPTVFAATASGELIFAQQTTVQSMLSDIFVVENLEFYHITSGNARTVHISFDLSTEIPIPGLPTYSKRYETAVTLYPDDDSEAGGCTSCPAPVCGTGSQIYYWQYCLFETCTETSAPISCG